MKSNEQKLIDMMFQIVYAVSHDRHLMAKPFDKKALWIGDQLNKNGFEGGPVGSSWFYLDASIKDKKV